MNYPTCTGTGCRQGGDPAACNCTVRPGPAMGLLIAAGLVAMCLGVAALIPLAHAGTKKATPQEWALVAQLCGEHQGVRVFASSGDPVALPWRFETWCADGAYATVMQVMRPFPKEK